MPRWQLACDTCEVSAWIGVRNASAAGEARGPELLDAWCEACQESATLEAGALEASCPRCQRPLTIGEPRFEEIFGALQNLAAVLAAWDSDSVGLRDLLPERPRFLTDLDPPAAAPGDSAEVKAALAALSAGAYRDAHTRLETLAPGRDESRLWRALAIACERRGELAAAEHALTRAIARGEADGIYLQRGALRARRGDFAAAGPDLARAGDRFEARWDRAALAVLEAVATAPGLPAAAVLEAARREAGAPSADWSDPTIGRLLWILLIERAESRTHQDPPIAPDARELRAAEPELEFGTFWDRAMVLEGYARLGLEAEAARIAAPLALELARALAAEPSLSGEAAAGIATVFDAAIHAIAHDRPGEACDAIVGLLQRDDLRHYRVPCRSCGRGAIGVVEVAEAAEETEAEVS